MKAKALAIFVTILVAMSMVGSVLAQGSVKYDEFAFSAYSDAYLRNEMRVYNTAETNPWKIPADGYEHSFNQYFSGKDSFSGYETASGQTGGGICDVASRFAQVAVDFGMSRRQDTPGHAAPVAGVAESNLTTIWDPGQDLWITNNTGHDLYIHWEVIGTTSVRMWVDENSSTTNSQGMQIKVGNQLRPGTDGIQVNTMGPDGQWSQGQPPQIGFQVPWGLIIPVGAIGILVFAFKRPEVVFGVTGELMFRVRDRLFMPRTKKEGESEHGWLWAISEGIRMGMRWWLVSIVFVFLAAPYALLVVRMLFNKTLTSSIQIPTGFVLLLIPAYFVNLTIIRLLNRGDRLAEKRQYRPVSRLGWIVTVVAFMFVISLGNQLINAKIAQAVAAAGGNPTLASNSFLAGLPDVLGNLGSSFGLNKTMTKQVARAAVDRFELITDGWAKIKAICGDIGCKDPALLYSIWVSESGKVDCTASKADPLSTGPGTCRSTQGALGACQFIPSTWAIYGNGNPNDIWELPTCIPAMNKMVGALNLYDQPDRIAFARRFSAKDGGSCWNCSDEGYYQALRVWDLWQMMKGM